LAVAGFALLSALSDLFPFWFVVFIILCSIVVEWMSSKVTTYKEADPAS